MHKWVYSKAECLKNELDAKGFDNLTDEEIEKAYYFSKILKNMVCIDKEQQIVEAMEKSGDEEEIMKKVSKYSDYPVNERFYSPKTPYMGPWKEPPYMRDMEYSRDMDRHERRMYTPDAQIPVNNNMGNHMNDYREGNAWKMRKKYFETKEMHPKNVAEDKQPRVLDAEKYVKSAMQDIMDMVNDAWPEEKQAVKNVINQFLPKL
jgi:hypothetical protein